MNFIDWHFMPSNIYREFGKALSKGFILPKMSCKTFRKSIIDRQDDRWPIHGTPDFCQFFFLNVHDLGPRWETEEKEMSESRRCEMSQCFWAGETHGGRSNIWDHFTWVPAKLAFKDTNIYGYTLTRAIYQCRIWANQQLKYGSIICTSYHSVDEGSQELGICRYLRYSSSNML